MKHAPELLAPAGHPESFIAAVENGADAVYAGLKKFSARATAANFSLDELSVLIPYAHRKKVSVYIALNSLIGAGELHETMDMLQAVSELEVNAVIVQDPGIFYLVRRFFPSIRLHASTLMTAHNSAGVNQLHRMGASRVVLARELTLSEIDLVCAVTEVPIEVFVHGALCTSYSGLCLASGFRGGHSGLQGRCVQPCRLEYSQGGREGFFLSSSDYCALPFIPQLKRMRIASFKIEGRMKPAEAVGRTVKAYRLVLDARESEEAAAVEQAKELLADIPSRRLTAGFLTEESRKQLLSPHRSGSSGLWIGTVKAVHGKGPVVRLRRDVMPGDRLRPESREGREKPAFNVSEVLSIDGRDPAEGRAGETVVVPARGDFTPGDRIFRVGLASKSYSGLWARMRKENKPRPVSRKKSFRHPSLWEGFPSPPPDPRQSEETLIIKAGDFQGMLKAFQSQASTVMLTATRSNLERAAKHRFTPDQKKRFAWSLPPILLEGNETTYYRAAVSWFLDRGFRSWEVNNWGHLDFFEGRSEQIRLLAGYRFNLRNQAALAEMARCGCSWAVLSLEISRKELEEMSRGPFPAVPLVTVFSWPPLFTSRLMPALQEHKPFFTAKREACYLRKTSGHSRVYADHPVCWFEMLPDLRQMGYRHFVIDVSDSPLDRPLDMERLLTEFKLAKPNKPCSTFNYGRRDLTEKTGVKR